VTTRVTGRSPEVRRCFGTDSRSRTTPSCGWRLQHELRPGDHRSPCAGHGWHERVGAAVVEALLENGVPVVTTARSVPAEAPDGKHYIAADVTTAEGGIHHGDRVCDRRRDRAHHLTCHRPSQRSQEQGLSDFAPNLRSQVGIAAPAQPPFVGRAVNGGDAAVEEARVDLRRGRRVAATGSMSCSRAGSRTARARARTTSAVRNAPPAIVALVMVSSRALNVSAMCF
jgi:hypothetical protein